MFQVTPKGTNPIRLELRWDRKRLVSSKADNVVRYVNDILLDLNKARYGVIDVPRPARLVGSGPVAKALQIEWDDEEVRRATKVAFAEAGWARVEFRKDNLILEKPQLPWYPGSLYRAILKLCNRRKNIAADLFAKKMLSRYCDDVTRINGPEAA